MITLVLYFDYRKRWNEPLSLKGTLDIPEILDPYVNDYRVNLYEIAWLTREQVNLFQSDFRVVADYFVQMRENNDYVPGQEKLEHVNEVLQLLNVMDEDHRFETFQNESAEAGQGVKTMSEWLSRVINESEEKGIEKGNAEGTIRTLWGLVKDHILSEDSAAERAGISTAEFREKAQALMAESGVEYIP